VRADQTVVDAATGRRLHKAGRIADGQQAITVRPRNRRKRQNFLARPAEVGLLDAPAPGRAAGQAVEVARRVAFAHHADAHADLLAAHDGHDPAEPLGRNLAAEMQLDVSGARGRQLQLRGMQQQPRHVETDLAMQ